MMPKPYKLALHIFRRDLRLEDNTALIEALSQSEQVIPCFIFDERQLENNPYKSDHSLSFMATSLKELNESLEKDGGKLYFFYGIAEEVIKQLISTYPIDAVFINRDYTPFSRKRDQQIGRYCKQQNVAFQRFADALLHEPEQIVKANKQPYVVYTPAARFARQIPVMPPKSNHLNNYATLSLLPEDNVTLANLLKLDNLNLRVKGGRKEGLRLLKAALQLKNYETERNFPAILGTSLLAPHHKFGTLSIREVYSAIKETLGISHMLINELYWRDFFTHIGFHFPNVFGHAFHEQYDSLPWSNNERKFNAWCNGETGFPIVDAGMRELNATGYMHNRVRMITASFLVKDLHIDWRWGEKYFAAKLIDYDPAVNNGNWQWAASTGCDAQPYFRIFNPWLQQKKFDAEALYIKHWIPELASLPAKIIHDWNNPLSRPMSIHYPAPITDHTVASRYTIQLYKNQHIK